MDNCPGVNVPIPRGTLSNISSQAMEQCSSLALDEAVGILDEPIALGIRHRRPFRGSASALSSVLRHMVCYLDDCRLSIAANDHILIAEPS